MARRREMQAEAEIEKAALARVEAGRLAGANADLRARNAAMSDTIAQMTTEAEDAAEQIALRDAEIAELDGELQALSHDYQLKSDELEALTLRFGDLSAIADERRMAMEEQDHRIAELSDALRAAEREQRESAKTLERLRSGTSVLEAHLTKEKNAVKRLEDRVARLTGQLAERDEQTGGRPGMPTHAAGSGARNDDLAGEAIADGGVEMQDRPRVKPRPAVRPAFGRRSDEADPAETAAGSAGEETALDAPSRLAAAPAKRQAALAAAPAPAPEPSLQDQTDRTDVKEPAPPPQTSLAKRLGLPERPEFAEDLGDGELRDRVGELAAKVVALTAEREGARSPLDAILNAEAAMAMPARRESAGPSLADRVRRLRQEARDHAAE